MPSGERTLLSPSRSISSVEDLDEKTVKMFWQVVEVSMQRVFGKSNKEASQAIQALRDRMRGEKSGESLLIYHDSPLQIASILSGAAYRPLTDEELLAYDKLWHNPDAKDRPSREQLLQINRPSPKAG